MFEKGGAALMIMTFIEAGIRRIHIEIVYFTHRKLMYSEAFKILGDKHLAEDAVHMSIEKIIAGNYTFNDVNSASTKNFVVIVSRNTAISMQKKLKTENTHMFFSDDMENLAEHTGSVKTPEEIAVSEENIERIKKLIEELNPIYRDVLILKLSQEKSNEQVAQLLGITVDTVKKRFTRGREMLKKRIIEEKICEK